jgi:16S rRNA processing protein RimM
MIVTVARISRAHGLKGEVTLDVRTDVPEQRLVVGAVFDTEPATAGPLTITKVRAHGDKWWAQFAQINDRDAAEAARGIALVIEADSDEEDDAWYVHDLIGLRVERPDGTVLGEVTDLIDMPAHDLLEVRQPDGHIALIPFVEEFVPEVDAAGGRVIITPPYGLLSGETQENTGETAGGGAQ